MWLSFRHKQGSKMDIKVTAVELANMTDTDSKEEQDTATSVDNICYERVPSKLSNIGQLFIFHLNMIEQKA